jgi:hypothetical protein
MAAVDLDEYPETTRDPDYAAMVLSFVAPLTHTIDLVAAAAPIGPLVDDLAPDLIAVNARDEGRSVSVRTSPGWERRPELTRRLLALARRHSQLSVSLPFAAGDDVEGSHTVATLTSLLELDGTTSHDCGDISVDHAAPAGSGDLALSTDALDELERLLASPLWQPAPPVPEDCALAV